MKKHYTIADAAECSEHIQALTVSLCGLVKALQHLQSDRIYNGRSTQHTERDLMHRINQTGRAIHSLKTKRGTILAVLRNNQLSLHV